MAVKRSNNIALNMVTKGIADTQSLITKGIIVAAYYETYSRGRKTGSGSQWTKLTKDHIAKHEIDTIKVFVDWYKKVPKKEDIDVELIKNEITVELLKKDIDIFVEVELISPKNITD